MLNLNDLNTDHGSNFFDVSSIKLKRVPDEDDENCDDVLSLRPPRLCHDSVGSRSMTSPWEFELSSAYSSQKSRLPPEYMSSLAFSEGGGLIVSADRPYHATPDTSFAILGDIDPLSSIDTAVSIRPPKKSPTIVTRTPYVGVACLIMACIIVHVAGLLVFFTPWYNNSIQKFVFRTFYSSFSVPAFEDDINAKRSAVAFVYLLFVGLVPMVMAASLWFLFSPHEELRRVIQIPRLVRRKPVLFPKWRPVYIDATCGEITFLVLLVSSNAFVFIHSLLRIKTEMASPSHQIWRDVGRAFAFSAMFNLVWLVLFSARPSSWTFYLELFGIANSRTSKKYRNWFGLLVVTGSLLHALCIAVYFQLTSGLASRLLPPWSSISTDPRAGVILFGEIALGAMLVISLMCLVRRHIGPVLSHIAKALSILVFLLALGVHYPLSIAWLSPTLVLVLIHKAAAWSHSRYPAMVLDMAPLPNGITRLVVRRTVDQVGSGGSNFVAGQNVYVRIPQVSWMQSLRCTIASSPSRHPGVMAMYIHPPENVMPVDSALEQLATGIHDIAKVAYAAKKPPTVYVDGFYGASHALVYEKYRCLVFIASEIGIARVLGMLEQLYHEAWVSATASLDRKVVQTFGGLEETHAPVEFREPRNAERQVWLLWTCADVCLFKEFEELFFRIKTLDPHEIHFKLRFFVTEIPLRDELQYRRLAPAGFVNSDIDPTQMKGAARGLPLETQDAVTSQTDPAKRPQTRSALNCWASRPFRPALTGPFATTLTVWSVLGLVVPVSIFSEWFALRAQVAEIFPLFRLLRNAFLVLLACVSVPTILAFVSDCLQKRHRNTQDDFVPENTQSGHRPERIPPTRGLKKLRSMTKMTEDLDNDQKADLESGSSFQDTLVNADGIGPDVMERLKIYSMRPDIDKFLRTVGRSFPEFAGSIGVFASGDESLIRQVETSTLASEAATGEWGEVNATFDVHNLR